MPAATARRQSRTKIHDKIQELYGPISGFPTTFIIDRGGTIRKHFTGGQPPSVIAPAFVLLASREDAADSGRRFSAWELVGHHGSPSCAYAEGTPSDLPGPPRETAVPTGTAPSHLRHGPDNVQ